MKFTLHLLKVAILLISLVSCSKPSTPIVPPAPVPPNLNFAKGADVSWITEMESSGIKFYDRGGNTKECISILKDLGMNSVRLRAWVNPVKGFCNTSDLVVKAVRANNLGMKILVDFHYSDTWADPGNQTKPHLWLNQDIAGLATSLYNYTTEVLNTLKNSGVTPSWVQVGNETNDGMLWPEGKASLSMSNFSKLVNSGYKAVKDVFPTAKVIVHLSNGYDNSLFRWMFDGLTTNHTNYDIIGMSLYPTSGNWDVLDNQCLANMNDMVTRYDKEVMVCEVGMPVSDSMACNSFLKDIIAKTKTVKNSRGLGVFYWEPESYKNWQGYKLGAFGENGNPSLALIGL